jgi:hypothetical protein
MRDGGTTPLLTTTQSATGASSLFTGLSGGWDYKFSVQAVNAARAGITTTTTGETRIGIKPSAPTSVTATPGSAQATVQWDPPRPTGFPLVQYTITPYQAGVAGTAIPVTDADAVQGIITGLVHAGVYSFTIDASNQWGIGIESDPTYDVTTS